MSTPRQTATRWQQLATQSEVDTDGRLTIVMHFVELESREEVTISVTASGQADIGYSVGGCQAMAQCLNHMAGGPELPGGKFVSKTDIH